VTATGSWSLYRFGYQFTGAEALDEAYVPFFGAFGAARDDAMVARWSTNPLGTPYFTTVDHSTLRIPYGATRANAYVPDEVLERRWLRKQRQTRQCGGPRYA
jgi:hypothetical protein